jgi:hypothetical protein
MTTSSSTERPPRRSRLLTLVSTVLILVALTGLSWMLVARSDAAANVPNEKCPVIAGNAASSDYRITYKNTEIRFCCNECVTEFLTNPEVYEGRVPQLRNQTLREKMEVVLDSNATFVTCAALTLLLAGLLLYRRSAKSQPTATSWFSRLCTRKVPLQYPLLILVGYLGWEVYSLREDLADKLLEDNIHFATMHDFGTPPVPYRPPLKPRVQAEFYRGNDERSPRLFNNGNYRTATFQVSLQDGQGRTLDHGAATGGADLFLRLEIIRPKFTPDFLFSDKIMGKMFLTQEFDKFLGKVGVVADEVPLTTLEEMQRWHALFPLGRVAIEGDDHRSGLVYLCEKQDRQAHWWSSARVQSGARYHYGIGYDLVFKDGKLTTDSDVWMGFLYRTRKFPQWKVPREQWFSHEAIPMLPGPNVQDPKLLGIEDYLERE